MNSKQLDGSELIGLRIYLSVVWMTTETCPIDNNSSLILTKTCEVYNLETREVQNFDSQRSSDNYSAYK